MLQRFVIDVMKKTIKNLIKKYIPVDYLKTMLAFHHDAKRIVAYGAAYKPSSRVAMEAKIILHYHVLEKGLTMPNRRIPFGLKVANELMECIKKFESNYGMTEQVKHGIGVLKEYYNLHCIEGKDSENFFRNLFLFLEQYPQIGQSKQIHCQRTIYYSSKNDAFPAFAKWRHTIRNYSGEPLNEKKIHEAVELAISAPSACNRQHVRVHCVTDKTKCDTILKLQGGNRGFGDLSDKVLIITADLSAEIGGVRERYDPYVNGGIFLMNLCYALSYHEVAHCILTGSLDRNTDLAIRSLCKIPNNEVIVSMLCCGEAPLEFDVAASPKRCVDEVLSFIRG